MKAIVCDVCGFCSIDGTTPAKCPNCMSTTFTENENAISEPQDINNLTELEKKHIPVIKVNKQCQMNPAECQNAVIIVGEIIHPMEEDHHIVYMDVYLDMKWIARLKLTHHIKPATMIHFPKEASGKLAVVELCNKHGRWIKEAEL